MTPAERKQLQPLLEELRGTVQELLLAGLTAASKSTIERLDVSFREASRMRLLRIGSTLRIANEEISRFTAGSAQFSPRRLSFFIGRAWILASAMLKAMEANDEPALQKLLQTTPTSPVESLSFVTLGISKRVVPGTFAAFDFRLRVTECAGVLAAGDAMVWSCVFPMRNDLDLPAEAFLHLPQKQKFKPSCLLEKRVVRATHVGITRQACAPARLTLSESSAIAPLAPFEDWPSFWKWEVPPAAQRLKQYRPTPLDLDVELQEEVFLHDWLPGEQRATDDGYDLLPLVGAGLPMEARLDRGLSGDPVRSLMETLAASADRPALYGTAHYESCRILFQPLSALGKDGPNYLTVRADKISQATLVKAMKFT